MKTEKDISIIKNICSNLLNDIKNILNKKKIKWNEISKYELEIKNGSIEKINKIISDITTDENSECINIFISVYEVNKNVYIRQKVQ